MSDNIVSEPRPSGPDRNFRSTRLIHEIGLKNVLSFGPDTPPLKLGNLNVLIGPNGSGKSNLIEAIGLLKSTPGDMADFLRRSGGTAEWIWKGNREAVAELNVVTRNPKGKMPLRHVIEFGANGQHFQLLDERVENLSGYDGHDRPTYFYLFRRGNPVIKLINQVDRPLSREDVEPNASILQQRKDPHDYPVLHDLGRNYERIGMYREWTFGRDAAFRKPQDAAGRMDRLESDLSNLGVFLNVRFGKRPKAKKQLEQTLAELFSGLERYEVISDGKSMELFLVENVFDSPVPASRLSDGTLRFVALAAILLDPEPPPLICIDEPELGLHPDVVLVLAKMMKQAAERTQLVVSTHSTTLVDAFTETPECVIVFSREEGRTRMERLDAGKLEPWLRDYNDSLGKLWTSGEIGGNRW